ncbi:hypothetical protein OG799_22650 [Micromonospora sp. NBC_00898]|uniref:hypothetical protein n=1 Tax=Micromonospora sp. NBC_00898 TaxID=2975981 RepID=UPI00386523A2|nr:hypothetical protein OG799_22650 [Micromonospora sp. NBC_00898]
MTLRIPGLDAVEPTKVAQYLRAAGWVERQRGLHALVWTLGDGDEELELLLPLDPSFRDYRSRLFDMLQVLSLAEERDPRAVIADIAALAVDTQHFRLLPNLPSGSIALLDVADAIRGVRDLMYAAAHSALENRPMLVQPRKRPQGVHRFVREVRLVAPTAGSFVLTAQVPLEPAQQERFPRQHRPMEPATARAATPNRQVVLQLHRAVRAAHHAAGESLRTGSVEPFAARADEGVSSNLCEAVSLIGRMQPFELRFSWAQSAPLAVQTPRLRFDSHLVEAIGAAAKELPGFAEAEQVEFLGQVVQLNRAEQGSGRVTLMGVLRAAAGEVRGVRLSATLSSDHYDAAVTAHRTQHRVLATGQLRDNHLHPVQSFTLSDN